MTVIGTGMGGPVVAIGLEELAHMGADTFIRVGSCGVFQDFQKVGDVIIGSGTVREGGTSLSYLPLTYPAVPTFSVLRALVEAGEELGIPATVGVGVAGDAFYAPRADNSRGELLKQAGGGLGGDGKRHALHRRAVPRLAHRRHLRLRRHQ